MMLITAVGRTSENKVTVVPEVMDFGCVQVAPPARGTERDERRAQVPGVRVPRAGITLRERAAEILSGLKEKALETRGWEWEWWLVTAVCVRPGSLAPRELAAQIWSWEWTGSRHSCSVLMSHVSGVLAWVPGGCRGKSNDLKFGAGLEGHHAEACCVSPRRLAVHPDCYPQLNPAGSAEGQGQDTDWAWAGLPQGKATASPCLEGTDRLLPARTPSLWTNTYRSDATHTAAALHSEASILLQEVNHFTAIPGLDGTMHCHSRRPGWVHGVLGRVT